MNKFMLVNKTTGKPIYGGQIFETENESPIGLLGGTGQRSWYWVDVTGKTDAQIAAKIAKKFTPTKKPKDTDENAVVTDAGGSWA